MKPFHFECEYPRVLSIAGSDSGGAAGIQADLKTFAALGCFGMTAITAITAQNTLGVRAIHSLPPAMLRDQIDAVMQDMGVHAVKIGMLHTPEMVRIVAAAIDQYQLTQVVFDPVMVATSGAVLIDRSAIDVLVPALFGRVALVTPNLDEAALLVGRALHTRQDMQDAAQTLCEMGARAVLLKGGHLPGETVFDLWQNATGHPQWFEAPRIHTPNTHGTGCTLSSAIAAYLALGQPMPQAIALARDYVRDALRAGAAVRTGLGCGPLNHAHRPSAMQLKRL
jgi:hydroxymethylpyrimidine/phosphomethylpyrimidine kinase